MKKQKTRRDWLMELPEPLNVMAVENCRNCNDVTLLNDTHCENSSHALLGAFMWDCTEEGNDFWMAVLLELKHLGK